MMVFVGTSASFDECGLDDANRAESEAATLNTWRDLYDSFSRYKECDDGGIATGYTSSIVNILSSNDPRFGDLDRLRRDDGSLIPWIVNHLNETLSQTEWEAISENLSRSGGDHEVARQAIQERLYEIEETYPSYSSDER
jgi:hypothetical protein